MARKCFCTKIHFSTHETKFGPRNVTFLRTTSNSVMAITCETREGSLTRRPENLKRNVKMHFLGADSICRELCSKCLPIKVVRRFISVSWPKRILCKRKTANSKVDCKSLALTQLVTSKIRSFNRLEDFPQVFTHILKNFS